MAVHDSTCLDLASSEGDLGRLRPDYGYSKVSYWHLPEGCCYRTQPGVEPGGRDSAPVCFQESSLAGTAGLDASALALVAPALAPTQTHHVVSQSHTARQIAVEPNNSVSCSYNS